MNKPLNPGDLIHQITWTERNVISQNAFGDDVLGTPAWRSVVTCRASIGAGTGRELLQAQQLVSEAQYVIRQHFYAGLKRGMRISWYLHGQVRTLDVLDIQDECGRGRVLRILAKDHVE